MRCIFIDLASHAGLLACASGERLVASDEVDHRLGDHELVPRIEQVLRKAGWSCRDLTHVACVVGPGGFTSLRVAVACANTLSDQLRIPSAGVHLSDLCAACAEGDFLWLHSTKREELFVRGFGSLSQRWPEAVHLRLGDFLERAPEGARWAGELLPEHEAAMRGHGMSPAAHAPVGAVLPGFLSTIHFEQKALLPWYGREW
jgi:tRNA threonylcarbamoyl adenosine modification protein YeaZ